MNLAVIGQVCRKKLRSEIPGVIWGVVKSQLLILVSNIYLKNVVDSSGVDMQAHDVAMHETVINCVGYAPKWLFPCAV